MHNVDVKIPVLFFKEDKKVIAYTPVFDLSTCGDTEEDARRRFSEAVSIFLNETKEMGTFEEVMEECGWHKALNGEDWIPPIYKATEEAISIPVGG
ncbi:MAG: hypothetical protein A2158_01235 [Chloroflexi bacterium RBG_13_46_14]|nr:MAG: hypothetical protein A2158_01235 [Chloroflexi bacterium RBG_13_46_14]